MSNNKIEFRIIKDIDGSEIDITNLSLAATNSFIILLESLKSILHDSLGKEAVRIQITSGSAVLAASVSDEEVELLEKDFKAIVDGNFNRNVNSYESWKKIHEIFSANGIEYSAEFRKGGSSVSLLNDLKNKEIFKVRRKKSPPKEWELFFIKGKMNSIGGKVTPNIHIECSGVEHDVIVQFEESKAPSLSGLLYSKIFISSWGYKQNGEKHKYELLDFYLNEQTYDDFRVFFDQLKVSKGSFRLDLIYDKIKRYLDDRNFGDLAKLLRLFDSGYWSISDLRTVLLITKAFKEEQHISSLRMNIKDKLEEKLGHKIK